MPLVTVAGQPCSGKSTRARELAQYLAQEHGLRVVVVTDGAALDGATYAAALGVGRTAAYSDRAAEGRVRAGLLAAVQRVLEPRTVVVLDAPNNIKGVRYQLSCAAREAGTPHCVLWCAASQRTREGRWRARAQLGSEANCEYDAETFAALGARFEEPDAAARWDAPLFVLTAPEDDAGSAAATQGVFSELRAALSASPARPPTLATAVAAGAAAVNADAFADVERTTQAVLDELTAQLAAAGGAPAAVSLAGGLRVDVRRPPGAGELPSLRRQFLRMARGSPMAVGPSGGMGDVRALFAAYVSSILSRV